MQEANTIHGVSQNTPSSNKKPKNRRKRLQIFAIFGVAMVALVATHYLAYTKGVKDQKAKDTSRASEFAKLTAGLPSLAENRWSVVGTVEEITPTLITVKNNKGLVQQATINSDTQITIKPSKTTDITSIKKGGKVIVIGTKENGKNTASSIRIQ